ncbi:MAG: hypothetical protein HDT15_07910 [Oscillibacter sp.]|nr:hypothetical protein [Oscillibacter sp.]
MKKRAISGKMMDALKAGVLHPFLEAVQKDDTLCLELRGTSINIYYRGGSLFCITEQKADYKIEFDTKYCVNGNLLPANPSVQEAPGLIPQYKSRMDEWFHIHPKYEREFQQLVARVNNSSGDISRSTDYYIADMEYAGTAELGARFDMVAFKWLSKGYVRKDTSKPSLALVELKYGDGALGGEAGIEKHLRDFNAFVSDTASLREFTLDMAEVFRQKCELGLVGGLKEKQFQLNVDCSAPEVIFAFAEHDPDSDGLKRILRGIKEDEYAFPIRLASASLLGCGLYEDHMLTVEEYLQKK